MPFLSLRGWLPAAILCLGLATETGGSPVHAPTASWAGGQQAGEEFALPRHYPVAHPEERYSSPRRQYPQYGGYAHRGLEAKTAQRLDYELEQPYQHEVNLYEYSYTESTAHADSGTKYGRPVPRRPVAGDGATLSRRYGGRLWWTAGMPLPVVGARGEPYIPRALSPEAQQGRGGSEGRRGAPTRRLLHNESLVGAARVQKSLQQSVRETPLFGQYFPDVRAAPTTTIAPTQASARQPSGLESFLRLMTEEDSPAGAPGEVVPDIPRDGQGLSRSNRGRGWEGQADPHERQPAPTPVTATAVLGSIMLLIILVVVMVALRVQWRERVKGEEEWRVGSPTVQPPTPAPSNTTGPSPSASSQHLSPLDHLHPEPIRIKAKGLLERRGSNTSLTLELAAPGPPPDVTSPPRHCTPEEFLMTAGNRMSRRQLRQCLKEGRALHAEFWEVPLNHPDKCDVPGSASKNRYRTVLPNESTRVTLCSSDPTGQYINANYVRGYEGQERAYIVTQGPLANTVVDLWRMVLQERSPAIVMITRLKEKQRVKCEPYVPSHTGTYGDITVTVRQVIVKSGYTIRQLSLQRGEERHDTLHFWYTAWPDHKAPTEADQLLAMALQVDHVRKQQAGTGVVVHCSAGIGRSGCFVAISIAINQLLEEDAVDILGILCQMRLDRGGMVQTGEQYEFIHRAVAQYASSLPSPRQSKCYMARHSITTTTSASCSSLAASYAPPTPPSPDDSRR
ncbi:receptor-type tyrosine-protein phosphatase T-like isoform X1 [Portunus trituberculatus]|uniref:receptor-type tyrosine-protein phosphatase T-like isoform X1 n=1 Tax=Portunus trituberculatus TaxID=210409 RepID=UPI001E1D21AD|nr:receptor-type tyrosine-protein phosphatase T-like isoform X1 [Portunus trituberculatus]XP_045100960.1 receptor-type tyrosine-protein phosphatase T-like isoform X1 [Portunus trituberculatus]XP_045100961.1 receptor-type tyrosine-protein phosphatase T-like isoform X1 [Portunus trituberculatus]XP_045100962.1 receptor-type tyrosine-protein phosphatase T-like isoform X1 [Portunus trituberculatus]